MLQSAFAYFQIDLGEALVFLRSKTIFVLVGLMLTFGSAMLGQTPAVPGADKKPEPTPVAPNAKGAPKVVTAEQVAESVIFFYGFPTGRERLNQIRKTTLERGRSNFTGADGK